MGEGRSLQRAATACIPFEFTREVGISRKGWMTMLCTIGNRKSNKAGATQAPAWSTSGSNTGAPTRTALAMALGLFLAAPAMAAQTEAVRKAADSQTVNAAADESGELVETADAASAEHYFQADGAGDGSDAAATAGTHAVAAGASSFAGAENAAAFGYGAMALGIDSTAVGALSLSVGQGASAFGFGTTAMGDYSSALGYGSSAGGFASMAMGYNATSNGDGAVAIGTEAYLTIMPGEGTGHFVTRADGLLSTAIGPGAASEGDVSIAIGPGAEAYGTLGIAMGHRAQAGLKSIAIGSFAITEGFNGVALGNGAQAQSEDTVSIGALSTAHGVTSVAIGMASYANGDQTTAVGPSAWAWGYRSVSLGNASISEGAGSLALGFQARTWGEGSIALGYLAQTGGERPLQSLDPPSCTEPDDPDCDVGIDPFDFPGPEQPLRAIALGEGAQAFGNGSMALGHNSLTMSENSVALGAGSMTDRDNTISVGASKSWMRRDGSTVAAFTRQIVNVAAGTEATDAVAVSQLGHFADALGGGSAVYYGVLGAPTYTIQGGQYYDVGSALAAVDTRLSGLQDAIDGVQVPPPAPDPDPEPPVQQPPATDSGVVYDGDSKSTLTLGGANGTQIRNVANGVAANDAATKGQMDAADAATLASANQYTDVTATRTLSSANSYTDQRFQTLSDQFTDFTNEIENRLSRHDERLDKVGAMSSAMMSMAINAANTHSPRGRVAVGAGWQNGESALSVGYAKPIGNRASFSIGGAFTDDESSAGIGFGLDL